VQINGDDTFRSTLLSNLAQISPIRGIVVHDVDGDGNLDLTMAGNSQRDGAEPAGGGRGNVLWLRGDRRVHFTPVSPALSGVLAPRNVGGLALVRTRVAHQRCGDTPETVLTILLVFSAQRSARSVHITWMLSTSMRN
jgi:hypothetical protein